MGEGRQDYDISKHLLILKIPILPSPNHWRHRFVSSERSSVNWVSFRVPRIFLPDSASVAPIGYSVLHPNNYQSSLVRYFIPLRVLLSLLDLHLYRIVDLHPAHAPRHHRTIASCGQLFSAPAWSYLAKTKAAGQANRVIRRNCWS